MTFSSLCPVNVAEATIDHFFDPKISSLELYEVDDLGGAGAEARPYWCGVKLTLPAGSSGPQLRMKRSCDLEVAAYDTFVLRASIPKSVRVDAAVTVDGREHTVIEGASGIDDFVEYEGGFTGARIESIEMTFTRTNESVTVVNLEWTMVASSARRETLTLDWPTYDDRWEGYLLAEGDVDMEILAPDIGIFFDAEQTKDVRRKSDSPAYRDLYRQLREFAEAHRNDTPERFIGRQNQALTSRYARSAHYDGPGQYGTFGETMRVLAFVGLMERDYGLMRMAVRTALSHAMCGSWRGWLDDHPMSTWEHRVFQQYRTAVGCAFVLDWAGQLLTDYGRHVITCAIGNKALADIQVAFMRHDYLRGNNQGFFFAWGWIVSVLAVEKQWPHAIEWLEHPMKIISETLDRYVLADGGADEGIGYLTGSLTQCLEALFVYAKRTGVDPRSLCPESLKEVIRYVGANLSTVPPDGSVVPIADGGRINTPPARLSIAQLYGLLGGEDAASLYAFLAHWPISENAAIPGAIFEILHGPEELPQSTLPIPTFAVFGESGMMSSLRQEGDRTVRIFLVGGKAHGGHSHDDRGSLILEIDRQNAIVDGSQIQYSDPQAEVMKFALFHNLLMPGRIEDADIRQINPCPVSTIVEGKGDEQTLDVSVDIGGAWASPVTHARRRVKSDRIDEFVVHDEMSLDTAGAATFRINALKPFDRVGSSWILRLDGVTLTVETEWTTEADDCRQIGVDGAKRPLFQLSLQAPSATEHRLATRFTIS